jgi:hypothetical protein
MVDFEFDISVNNCGVSVKVLFSGENNIEACSACQL